ncbi:VirD4-like conjugal transfer protein, CD1115 family [Lentibacillus amyloliquefaciens]|uniref:Type IV secretion system protein VirD4 n=1 Tax=Lentibacillus amyloliquefaciens TaxID=1472767 RepID=A0A0U4G4Q5_9BACI|nr:type IV secretory system conjugative DNA transfer family protein [Lentibacillus amyloliquefaciens]ALX47642.1 type IV secretion system protein VirD4 [Lentibacillus amyloliquefaciens]
MNTNHKPLTERLSNWQFIVPFILLIVIMGFFLANFLLHFFQQVLHLIEGFANNPEQVNLSTFSVDWECVFIFQKEWLEFYIGFYILVGISLLKLLYNIKMNYQTINRGQHGTNEFESVKNMKKQYQIIPASKTEYEGKGGTIIGGLQETGKPYRLLLDDAPVHTMVIGITRSGKGETFVVPMIDVQSRASEQPSMVINDPKGELAGASYETLKERGYAVYVFNLIEHAMSMGFNPLQLVIDSWKQGRVSDAQKYANSVAFSLYHNPNAKDPFWSNSAKSLVTAIILALTEDMVKIGKEERVTMYSVANFLSSKGSETDEEENNVLDEFFQARDENNPARLMYATSNFSTGNTRGSIFSVAMDKLQIFTLEPNAKVTGHNSLDLTEIGFGDKPVAVFLATPDSDKSNDVLASIFVSQLYRVNSEKATKSKNGKMKRHVQFILDEFGNMPAIDGMASMVTVGAGRGFRYHLVVQAYSQVKSAYGEESETIIGNCSNQIYILTEDKSTAEHYSSMLGTKTITDVSRSGDYHSFDKSHSESTKERSLLTSDELMRLKEGQSVLIRVNKRQDKKRKKIEPKPIFNQEQTSHKFRFQYLADDFDTDHSVMMLPIMSETYQDMDLNSMVYSAKSNDDVFLRMADVMTDKEFERFKRHILQIEQSQGEVDEENTKALLQEVDHWSFLHYVSFIVHHPHFSRIHLKVLAALQDYLPDDVMQTWQDKATKRIEEQVNQNEKANQASEQQPSDEQSNGDQEAEKLREKALS